jgi:hypothetical protein
MLFLGDDYTAGAIVLLIIGLAGIGTSRRG